MHYIIGTDIIVTNRTTGKIKPGMSSTQIRQASTRGSKYTDIQKLFFPGEKYVLNRIYMKEEKYIYKFSSSRGEIVEAEFDSIAAAEGFIAETRREIIPDYTSTYTNKTD